MNDHKDEEYTIWVIRWIDPYRIESRLGTRKEVEEYAKEKSKECGDYIIA